MSPPSAQFASLEHISPQVYIRFILCFRVAGDPDDVSHTLKSALDITSTLIPSLRNVVIPVHDSRGRELKGSRTANLDLLQHKFLENIPWTYDELSSRGFPCSDFDADSLCPTGLFANPVGPVPIFRAQANFLAGGLLLGLSVWHGAFDATSIATILQIWAQQCSVMQGSSTTADPILSAEAFDKSGLSKSSSNSTLEDHPEFLLRPNVPSEIPPVMLKVLTTQIFHFSAAAIAEIKEASSLKHASNFHRQSAWISSNDVISALLWRSVAFATYHSEHPAPHTTAMFCSALNARKRTNPLLAPDLLCTALCFQTCQMPMDMLLSVEHSLADTALELRRNTEAIDAKYIDSLISMIDSVANPSLLLPVAFVDVLRTSTLLTTWAALPMYDFDWGSQLGGHCERVRTVSTGMFNGLHVILPQLPEAMGGGLEVAIALEGDVMEALKKDTLWAQYTTLK